MPLMVSKLCTLEKNTAQASIEAAQNNTTQWLDEIIPEEIALNEQSIKELRERLNTQDKDHQQRTLETIQAHQDDLAGLVQQKKFFALRSKRLASLSRQSEHPGFLIPAEAEKLELNTLMDCIDTRLKITTDEQEIIFLSTVREYTEAALNTHQAQSIPLLSAEKNTATTVLENTNEMLQMHAWLENKQATKSEKAVLFESYALIVSITNSATGVRAKEKIVLNQIKHQFQQLVRTDEAFDFNQFKQSLQEKIMRYTPKQSPSDYFKRAVNALFELLHLNPLFKTVEQKQKMIHHVAEIKQKLTQLEQSATKQPDVTSPLHDENEHDSLHKG